MKNSNLIVATASACMTLGATFANAATLATFGDPWGQRSTIEARMDDAFGVWTDVDSPTDTSFLSGESFVYLEGGAHTTNELESFLTANGAALLNWVTAGGSMFINAAPNVGNGLAFGGLVLNYPSYCASNCNAVDVGNPIFDGVGTNYGGNYFSHATISGGTALIINGGTGDAILSELAVGNGFLMMGGMTTSNFHSGNNPGQLRSNILAYGAAAGTAVAPVPLPAASGLLIGALCAMGAMARRNKKVA